jgi:thiamine-monophosphate kinase
MERAAASMGEFELIDRYFRLPGSAQRGERTDIALGIGDDAAVVTPPLGRQLVAALDTLVEGRHFPVGTDARSLGHRALAVNLSDLAAMGAMPLWYLLSLTLPRIDTRFLSDFSQGMHELAALHGITLIGGDTTAGPLSVSIQVLGHVAPGAALLRSGARPGDLLYVSGTAGDAAAGLQLEQGKSVGPNCSAEQRQQLRNRFLFPTPRLELGQALLGIASACIDVSDGLAGDAQKLAQASGCGVRLNAERVPVSTALTSFCDATVARETALTGGDDYELCFAVPAAKKQALEERLINVKCPVTCIGDFVATPEFELLDHGKSVPWQHGGFDHFAVQE